MSDGVSNLDLIFAALSDKTRRHILERLVGGDLGVGEIAASYDMSLPAISKHISVLQKAGLVEVTKSGKTKKVSIVFDEMKLAQIWLETLSENGFDWDDLEVEIESFLQ